MNVVSLNYMGGCDQGLRGSYNPCIFRGVNTPRNSSGDFTHLCVQLFQWFEPHQYDVYSEEPLALWSQINFLMLLSPHTIISAVSIWDRWYYPRLKRFDSEELTGHDVIWVRYPPPYPWPPEGVPRRPSDLVHIFFYQCQTILSHSWLLGLPHFPGDHQRLLPWDR